MRSLLFSCIATTLQVRRIPRLRGFPWPTTAKDIFRNACPNLPAWGYVLRYFLVDSQALRENWCLLAAPKQPLPQLRPHCCFPLPRALPQLLVSKGMPRFEPFRNDPVAAETGLLSLQLLLAMEQVALAFADTSLPDVFAVYFQDDSRNIEPSRRLSRCSQEPGKSTLFRCLCRHQLYRRHWQQVRPT